MAVDMLAIVAEVREYGLAGAALGTEPKPTEVIQMTLRFNLTGKARTKLAKAISQELNTEATYIKGRIHAYIIGDYTLDREGILTGPDNRELAAALQGLHGFVPASADYTTDEEVEEILADLPEPPLVHPPSPLETREEPTDFLPELHELDEDNNEVHKMNLEANKPRLTIVMPTDGFNPDKLDNLCKMVIAKEALLKAALGVEDLPIRVTEDGIKFPWFWSEELLTADEHETYATLISLLCETAKEKKRVNAKAGEMPENPKFAFRCWLISIGMIGTKYKTARRILLSRLEGCSAWKGGPPVKVAAE